MNLKAIIIISLLFLFGFIGMKIRFSVQPRFTFSFPLHSGDQEILATLPTGRYALVISTNSGDKTFGVIPPGRDYSAQIDLEIRTCQVLLAQGINPHYLSFSLNKATAGKVKFVIHVEGLKNETVMLHLGRGF